MRALVLLVALAGCGRDHQRFTDAPTFPTCPSGAPRIDVAMFHGDRARTGWNPLESELTPSTVASSFGWLWDSDPLDADGSAPPRVHATPLYFDDVGPQPFVVVATSNARVYAIAACSGAARAGTILWKTRLSTPLFIPNLDGGLPLGVLSTPVADLDASPPRLYVTSVDAAAGWELFALDLTNGATLPGWPLPLAPAPIESVDGNGPSVFEAPTDMAQRGALALSPSNEVVYVPFGSFADTAPGWMVAVDTRAIAVKASFAAARSTEHTSNGGIWGAGGAAVDELGGVWATAGNALAGPTPGTWGETLLAWSPSLALAGTYTPFNHCQLDRADTDVGGATPVLLPSLDPTSTSTTELAAFGSKQGNVYLVDRSHLPGALDARPPCSTDSTTDGSLVPPGPQPQFGARGPLNVFGPYTEQYGNRDYAKMRTTLAYFEDEAGGRFLFAAGSTKAAADSTVSVPPSVVRLRVVTGAGTPAYLAVDASDPSLAFANPGSPVVTSNGNASPIIWVVDQDASRGASTLDPNINNPVLHAVDGTTMQPIWQSPPDRVGVGGKYTSPTVAHGWVFVATDRLQAFGLAR
jgi:hypothetical protein